MFTDQTQLSLINTPTSAHPFAGLMEEFRRSKSEFKTGNETVQFKIAHSVFNILTSESSKMKERSEIGIRSGLLESFSERLSSICPTTLSALLSSVLGVMVTSVSEERLRLRRDLIPSLLALSSHADSSLSTPATHSLGLLCGGNLSSMEAEGVLSSGIIERLCTRIESESSELDVLPTLLVLDRMCSGLNEVIETQKSKPTDQDTSNEADLFSLTRRCEFALARIEAAVLVVKKKVGGQRNPDKKTKEVQKEVGGMLVRHFQSSIHSSKKEIGEIGIDLVAVRREMEAEREILKKAEQERQREFTMKMREMEEMKKMNEELIEEGRQRREEKKREAASKRKEEEEQRRNVKEGAATIEVFARDKFTISGNVFTKSVSAISSLFSHSFGPVVVRITIVFKQLAIGGPVAVGLIAADMVEQATQHQGFFSNLTRAASWSPSPNFRSARQNEKYFHEGSACKAVAVGQRVVMEADGREGKRTLKLSQDGETQPAFFSNIPVPFRFGIYTNGLSASVEIVSSEVLREPSMVGGRLEVVMD